MSLVAAPRKKALIVKFGQIGDVIMALPAARALYERGFDIDWLAGRAARPLLECYSWIRTIPVDDKAILRGSFGARVKAMVALWRSVISPRYDLCATLYYDRRFRMITLPVRAGRKLMLSRKTRSTMLIPGRHHTDEFLRLLLDEPDICREYSAAPVRPDQPVPSPLPHMRAPRRIALVPGGTNNILGEQALRRWPIERYVAIAGELLNRGWEVLLLGGPEDEWVRPCFASLLVTDCINKYSLPQVVAICDASDALITHDTGPLHLAGLSDICLVGVFGPTDPATRIPRRPLAIGIWGGEGFACRPCYDGAEFAPCPFNGCMHQVTPEMVLRQMDQLLAARSAGIAEPWSVAFPSTLGSHGVPQRL